MTQAGALAYLTATTVRNRLRLQASRLRRPRYLLALVAGLLYLWLIFLSPSDSSHELSGPFTGVGAATLMELGVLALALSPWLVRDDAAGLVYSPAEVHFLFAGPIARRTLVAYRLLRLQLVVAANAILWVFVLRRFGSPMSAPLRFVAVWALFSNIVVHRVGASLVRTSWLEHGRVGLRRHPLALAAVALAALAIVGTLAANAWRFEVPGGASAGRLLTTLGTVLATPPASVALFPIRTAVAPVLAASTSAWASAIALSLALLLAQTLWVLRTEASFEEAAAQASLQRARRVQQVREGRLLAVAPAPASTRRAGAWRLAPVGHPAVGIVWKNVIALRRTQRLGAMLGLPISAVLVTLMFVNAEQPGGAAHFVVRAALVAAAMLLLSGSQVLRNDLRQDMLHLATLKTLPVRGAWIVAGEVAGAALPLAGVLLALAAVAYAAALADPTMGLAIESRTAMLVAAPAVLAALCAAVSTVHNGTAVLFPGWVRLGPHAGGVESMGQGMLSTIGTLLVILVLLLPPALLTVAGLSLLPHVVPKPAALAVALVVASALLLGEVALAVMRLGRALERAEPGE